MKLLYPAAGLLSTVASYNFSAADVEQLQSAINQRLAQRSNVLQNVRSRVARDVRSTLNRFNFEKTRCEINVESFWEDCQQCVAQQCEDFTERVCGQRSDGQPERQEEGALQQVATDFQPLLAQMSRQLGIDFEIKEE